MALSDSAQERLTTLRNISQSLTEDNNKKVCYCQSQMPNLSFLSEALLLLPWGRWWCFGRTQVLCHSKCSLMHPGPQYRVLKCAGLALQDPLESRMNISIIGTNVCISLSVTGERLILTPVPNMLLRSWMRIQPILQPGTNQRLARPPQDRTGTSLLRGAKDWKSQPGKTCRMTDIS